MKLFCVFIKRYISAAVLFLVFAAVFAAVFSLYDLHAEAVLYASLLCASVGAVFIAAKFIGFRRRYIIRQRLIDEVGMLVLDLPEPKTPEEEQYCEVIAMLRERCGELQGKYETDRTKMLDYFTTWVHQIKIPISVMQITLEQRVSVLDDKKAELKELTEQKDELTKKKELLLLVKKEISESELSLKRKHVKPILDKFRNYALLIEDAIGHKVEMDKDYSVKYDIMGELRSYLHLSSGNLSICALCFRLAMIDSMFETEQPFIILDDPFVYLDSEHFNKTKELIQKLGKDKQIVYFCCHDSRSLK